MPNVTAHSIPAIPPRPLAEAALAPWLDRCAALSPEYGGGLSTHLPMALHALHALGAPPARLAELFDRVAPRIPARKPLTATTGALAPAPEPAAQGLAWLGSLAAFEPLHHELTGRLARLGPHVLLRQTLPLLMPGVSAVAFHGLIRTAHGVAAGHAGELVTGLAYWAARHQTLLPPGQPLKPPGTLPLPAWLDRLRALPAPTGSPARLINGRMQAWSTVPGFADAAAALRLQDDTLDELSALAAGLYTDSGNFTVLHLVTASQAMGVLRPWLDDERSAMRAFTSAAAAALRASGWPALAGLAPLAPAPPWPELAARAIAADDEHVIKLVHASRALWQRSGKAVFQSAAQRALSPTASA